MFCRGSVGCLFSNGSGVLVRHAPHGDDEDV